MTDKTLEYLLIAHDRVCREANTQQFDDPPFDAEGYIAGVKEARNRVEQTIQDYVAREYEQRDD